MRPPETIETARLILRKPLAPEDALPIHHGYAQDPAVTRYLTWLPHRELSETEELLRLRLDCWDDSSEFSWVITTRSDRRVIGMIAATAERQRWRFCLGYVLARSHWHKGYMTEAACGVIDALLSLPGVMRVWAYVDEENFASMRVLEKAGMQREGLLRRWSLAPGVSDVPRDCWSFSRVR